MHILFLCVEIFLARIIDVSLGTIRTIIVVKGKNLIGSILGFIEVAVWFLVVEQALTTDDFNLFIVISYSLGFATGTYVSFDPEPDPDELSPELLLPLLLSSD